ncbi:hypothetical protein CWS02_05180 [Enterobacter sp. EA-1]|nr:hypothetical protein CWS02_05180 [Enterobacter sp. EA-1]
MISFSDISTVLTDGVSVFISGETCVFSAKMSSTSPYWKHRFDFDHISRINRMTANQNAIKYFKTMFYKSRTQVDRILKPGRLLMISGS